MFCGTGKSLLMRYCKSTKKQKLCVYVFPSLSLIEQFQADYLTDFPKDQILLISSDLEGTTNHTKIQTFLKKKRNKIICITYHSYETLLNNLGENIINICIYDEAHHAVGETYQKLIFEKYDYCEKQIFFTATPKNANGIVMYDRSNIESGMCGNLVYDYTYLTGLHEGYLNPFEIRIDLSTENTNISLYESICRAILVCGNNRVLTFHSDVNTDRNTSVHNFVDSDKFIECFNRLLLTEEFNDKRDFYKKITFIGLSSSIHSKDRKKYLDMFDTTPNNEIYIISSCETIGEGIDTKHANMCVFIDPKSSFVKIIQNIGRIVRKQFGMNKPHSTILIPCWVDKTKYLECNGDRDKCDEVIRSDLNKDGNFNGILNVLSALKQEDEDIYDICLHYPDTFSPQEIKNNLKMQGYNIEEPVGEGSLLESLEYISNVDLDYEEYEDCETNEEIIMRFAEDNDVCIEIHTNSFENPIERYNTNSNSGEIVRLYKNIEEDVDEPTYQAIVKKNGMKKTKDTITSPNRTNRNNINVHVNPDIKVLWNIANNFDITKEICSCILDCEVIDTWNDRLDELKQFIDENNKRPNKHIVLEKKMGIWLCHQIKNYKNKTEGMKNENRRNVWEVFVEKYKEYLLNYHEKWDIQFNNLKQFIDENKKRPSITSKNKEEKRLGGWLSNQITNYKNKTNGMKNEDTRATWEDFVEEYKEYLLDDDEKWDILFNNLKLFINENKNRPSSTSKNKEEKRLGGWLSNQITNYKNKTDGMKNEDRRKVWDEDRRKVWEDFVEECKEYLLDNDEKWDIQFNNLKLFINENKKRPSDSSKNKEEKLLGVWLCHQITNYKNKTDGMKNEDRRKVWEDFVEECKEYLLDNDEKWDIQFNNLKLFINENKKRPSVSSKNKEEKLLGVWLCHQIKNYKNKTKGMKNEDRRKVWFNFIQLYPKIFNIENPDKEIKDEITPIPRQIPKKIKIRIIQNVNNEESKEITPIPTQIPIKKKRMKIRIIQNVINEEPKETKEIIEEKKRRVKSEIETLHQRYKTMTSQNLNNEFKEKQELWKKYHAISEENEQSFPEEEIPRNRIITELHKIKTKRTKQIVDMGCGKGFISQHFKNDNRFSFINYDHISDNDAVISCDISNIPLENDSVDICILSLAMWGSNCKDYIKESNRILESGGKLYIIEPTKRWSNKDENGNMIEGKQGNKLRELLQESGFIIIRESIEKFSLFECVKS